MGRLFESDLPFRFLLGGIWCIEHGAGPLGRARVFLLALILGAIAATLCGAMTVTCTLGPLILRYVFAPLTAAASVVQYLIDLFCGHSAELRVQEWRPGKHKARLGENRVDRIVGRLVPQLRIPISAARVMLHRRMHHLMGEEPDELLISASLHVVLVIEDAPPIGCHGARAPLDLLLDIHPQG